MYLSQECTCHIRDSRGIYLDMVCGKLGSFIFLNGYHVVLKAGIVLRSKKIEISAAMPS